MQNRHTLAKRVRQHWQLYVFLILPVVWVLIFKYYPMIGAQIAFKDFNIAKGVWDSEWVGLYHFKKFLNAYQFKRVIKNTIVLSVYSILAAFPFPILFALGVNVMRGKRSKKLVQTHTYMPHFSKRLSPPVRVERRVAELWLQLHHLSGGPDQRIRGAARGGPD